MQRLVLSLCLSLSWLSCGNKDSHRSESEEKSYLEIKMSKVSKQLADMGFPIDISKVDISVKESREMAVLFNQITNESKRESAALMVPTRNDDAKLVDKGNTRLAYYDPNSKTIVFMYGASELLSDGYLAHELAHVYQDQKWGFSHIWQPYQDNPSEELFNITQFIIEGHAELVREAYEQLYAKDKVSSLKKSANLGNISENDCIVCDFKQSTANLPYSLGMRFLLQNYRSGGWPLVETFFESLPTSTERNSFIPTSSKKMSQPNWTYLSGTMTNSSLS